jgi:hypothetical protein
VSFFVVLFPCWLLGIIFLLVLLLDVKFCVRKLVGVQRTVVRLFGTPCYVEVFIYNQTHGTHHFEADIPYIDRTLYTWVFIHYRDHVYPSTNTPHPAHLSTSSPPSPPPPPQPQC